jgi:hypothetical protein
MVSLIRYGRPQAVDTGHRQQLVTYSPGSDVTYQMLYFVLLPVTTGYQCHHS